MKKIVFHLTTQSQLSPAEIRERQALNRKDISWAAPMIEYQKTEEFRAKQREWIAAEFRRDFQVVSE